MKSRFFIFLAVLLTFTISMAACGGSKAPPKSTGVYELNLQSHDSPVGATAQFLDAWAKAIKEASDDRIIITNFHGGSLGGPGESYNLVHEGIVDIAWGLPLSTPGAFPATDAIALPFIGAKSPIQASYALWELYDSTDYLKPEWADVHMILLHTNCDAPLITSTKIGKAEDLKGVKMRINDGPPAEWARLAGANPMNISLGDVYSSIEKGEINGITSISWDLISENKFYENGTYFLDYAIHVDPCFLVMNKNSYNNLPDDLKAIINQYSGYGALEVAGSIWADVKTDVFNRIEEAGNEIYILPADEQTKLDAYGVQAREKWMSEIKEKGIDANRLVNKTIKLLDKYKDK